MINLDNFIETTRSKGGSTLNFKNESPIDGYMVSLPEHEIKLPESTSDDFLKVILRGYVKEHLSTLKTSPIGDHCYYLGSWIDKGYIYIDISCRYNSRAFAEAAMVWGDQLACYDVKNQVSIYLTEEMSAEI